MDKDHRQEKQDKELAAVEACVCVVYMCIYRYKDHRQEEEDKELAVVKAQTVAHLHIHINTHTHKHKCVCVCVRACVMCGVYTYIHNRTKQAVVTAHDIDRLEIYM